MNGFLISAFTQTNSRTTMKKKHKLLLNLVEDKKYKHHVAMVNHEAEWNQHESNAGMARMFLIMLLIHVVVIGGIIVYDWLNAEEAAPKTLIAKDETPRSALPPPAIQIADAESQIPIEDCSTYEWKTGDSLDSVATKLGVSKEVLIRMNMLDKGTQLETNSIIRYPRQPVVKALSLNVDATKTDEAQPLATAATNVAATEATIPLIAPGEKTFSFSATIENELTPVPGAATNSVVKPNVQQSSSEGTTQEATREDVNKLAGPKDITEDPPAALAIAAKASANHEDMVPAKTEATTIIKQSEVQQEDIPKAIPVKRNMEPMIVEKEPAKKANILAATKLKSHTVRSGETLYAIAIRNGVTVKSLQSANKIAKPETLREGMKLIIPGK